MLSLKSYTYNEKKLEFTEDKYKKLMTEKNALQNMIKNELSKHTVKNFFPTNHLSLPEKDHVGKVKKSIQDNHQNINSYLEKVDKKFQQMKNHVKQKKIDMPFVVGTKTYLPAIYHLT